MTAITDAQPDMITSAIPDLGGVRLGDEAGISDAGYARIMRLADDDRGAGTPVYKFNSSI